MQNENILIDQLEDQLIDNPDASTTKQLNESSLDEAFQKKLNGRANQLSEKWGLVDANNSLDSGRYGFLVTKPILDYTYADVGSLRLEITEWFCRSDYDLVHLRQLPNLFPGNLPERLSFRDCDLWDSHENIDHTFYFVLGSFVETTGEADQLKSIISNCQEIITRGFHKPLIELLIRYLEVFNCAPDLLPCSVENKVFGSNYFKSLTIIYFLLIVAFENPVSKQFVSDLAESNLINSIMLSIEIWNTHFKPYLRVRSILLLLWKLILVEFGGTARLREVDDYLVQKFNVKNKDRKMANDVRLTCSPLEFYTFKEDIMDKYPLCEEKTQSSDAISAARTTNTSSNNQFSSLETMEDDLNSRQAEFMAYDSFTASLSNLIEIPRPNKSHSIMGQFPSQTLHIATPVPSPPSTPSEFMSGGEKIRKMYHVNQGMPFIYPTDGSSLPAAINEAKHILLDSYYESYSYKRLWDERQRYMRQERGNLDQYSTSIGEEDPSFDASDCCSESETLGRVEKFYGDNLPSLHSLVQTLVLIIKSNTFDVSLKEMEVELDPKKSFSSRFSLADSKVSDKVRNVILGKLEILRIKETTLKACSAIPILLLRWFKTSHVMKYYYFSSLLFDAQFLAVFIDFLGNSMNNPALQESVEGCEDSAPSDIIATYNKLRNPAIEIPEFDFFNACQGVIVKAEPIKLINREKVSDLPSSLDENNQSVVHITEFNEGFCFILSNLFNVTNKILIKNISQRVFVFNETKPTDLLKIIMLNYDNDSLKLPILRIFKKLAPYQGRKWRTLNIDVVSQIYLNLKLSLRDTWLSGKDLENDFNNSFDQEIALRSMLQFYNVRNYPEKMKSLGYSIAAASFPQAKGYA